MFVMFLSQCVYYEPVGWMWGMKRQTILETPIQYYDYDYDYVSIRSYVNCRHGEVAKNEGGSADLT